MHMVGSESTTYEIEEGNLASAILGIGSFEQHSHHLPVETDFIIAEKVSRKVAERIGAFYLNPLPYSVSLEHIGFAGTVLLKPETLKRVIWDIAESVARWGVKYLVLLNFHGGNFILNPTAREWNMTGGAPKIILLDFYNGIKDMAPNLHAGEVETSLLLFLRPESVRDKLLKDHVPDLPRSDLTHFGMKGISPEGVWGYASRASAEKGREWFYEGVSYLVERYNRIIEKFQSLPPAISI